MGAIEKKISPFIAQQFPQFYRSEGPNFVAFMRAYYEWLESTGNAINRSRSLLEYMDVDTTEQEFINYFKNTYIASLPDSVAADKGLLVKHILDLYRAKGSKRAYELLFRLLFNEDIELYIPGDYLLRPSDGNWIKVRYIETTSHPRLSETIGKAVTNSSRTSTAVVETVSRKVIDGKTVNVVYLSSVRGSFKYGDRLLCNGIIDIDSAPVIIGSLTAIPVENGGSGFRPGDILDVNGAGAEGKARVAAVRDENGKVAFTLVDGGSGFSINATVSVATTLNLIISDPTGTFSVNTSVKDATTNANGTVVFANSSYLTLINFSGALSFTEGNIVTDGVSNAVIENVTGGGGSGASFQIGGLVDKEVYQLNSDIINDYLATKLDTQIQINISAPTGAFTAGDTVTSSGNAVLLEVTYLTANSVAVGESLSNATLGIANLFAYSSDGALIRCTGAESDLDSANLIAGATLVSNTSSSVITLLKPATKETVTGNGIVFSSNSTAVVANVVSGSPYYLPGATLIDANTPASNATIVSQTRLTDWGFPTSFPPAFLTNLDAPINQTLTIYNLEVGTIAFLNNINPGSGYSSDPYVDIIQPDVARLGELDENGLVKGHNAIVDTNVSSAEGVVTAVEVFNSGFGYVPSETLTLTKDGSESSVRGVAVVDREGSGEGFWLGNKGFLSDIIKIQDSDYYQVYSYEIVAQRMMSTYEGLVNDLVHPAGYKMFGRYRSTTNLVNDPSILANSSISQTIV
mgnify:CR=1 FL=1